MTIRVAALLVALVASVAARAQDCDVFLKSSIPVDTAEAQLVENLDRINLGPFELSGIPKGAIKVQSTQLVGKELLFAVHFKIDTRKAKNKPSFNMSGPAVGGAIVQGRVRELDVRGCMTIPGRTETPRIEVPKNRFFADILTPAASLPTTLAGVLKLDGHYAVLRNRTPLKLSMSTGASSGAFDLNVADARTDAIEILAEGSKRSLLLTASFRMPGESSWLFDLDNPKLQWQWGRIQARNIALTADEPYVMPLPRLDLEFRKLSITLIEVEKPRAASAKPSAKVTNLALDAGTASLLGTPTFRGRLRSPMKTSGRLDVRFTDDGQVVVQDYELTDTKIDLDVAEFADGGSVRLTDSTIVINAKKLTAQDIEGDITVQGGRITFSGEVSGTADIGALTFKVAGKRDALDGTGSIDVAKFSVSGNASVAPIDRCPGSALNVAIKGADASHVTGDVQLVKGKTVGSLKIGQIKAAAGLSYFRCEWDQKVGHAGRIETNGIPYPCGTWEDPFKTCQDKWVLWDGGDVYVRWVFVANPTVTDVGIELGGVEYNIEKARVCDGKINGLTLGLYAVSLTPNLPASGTIADLFRDTVQTLMGIWQTALVDLLGPPIGAMKVVKLECK